MSLFAFATLQFRLSILSLAIILFSSNLPGDAYPFIDVSGAAGLKRPNGPLLKYGGASVADFNGDGRPDLLFGHHGSNSIQLYFNNGDGTFRLSKAYVLRDIHALNPVRLLPERRSLSFVLSRGGAYGWNPAPPHIYRTTRDPDVIVEDTKLSDFARTSGRGRTSLFLNLKTDKRAYRRPDMLVLNAQTNKTRDGAPGRHHFGFTTMADGTFRQSKLKGNFPAEPHNYATLTDINGDGQMEVVMLSELSIWKVTADFRLTDISSRVLPDPPYYSVAAAAELDYDNDGDWDLFVVRSATMDLRWTRDRFPRLDILFRNDGGRYTDVSTTTGVPRNGRATLSRGVTVGDFDNDGFVDIFIVRYDSNPSYILLKNNGKGGFTRARVGFSRRSWVPGDMATAVDYDGDGRLDLVLSEGDWFDARKGGNYRLMKNIMVTGNSFVLVRVKSAPGRRTSSLHAVVRLTTTDGVTMMRRVGSPGTAVSMSYIETVHFGLGKRIWAQKVTVTWANGMMRARQWIRANSTIAFGTM